MRNVGLIGKGYWGKNIARNLDELNRLGMIVDSRSEVLKASQEEYPGVTCGSSLEELLENKDIKSVFIATPAPSHGELSLACLRAGKDVFVEKPMCMTPAEGEKLKAAVQESGQILMVGHILLFHPCVVKLKELIQTGQIGQIQYIYSNRLNFGKIRTEENIFWSFAPHDISVINYLLGNQPESVCAEAKDNLTKNVHDTTLSLLEYPGGIKAHIFVSWLHPYKEQRLVVVGDQGMVEFSDTAANKLLFYPHQIKWIDMAPVAQKADAQSIEYESWEPLRRECEHFLECVETRSQPISDVENGLQVVRVLTGSDRSIEENGKRVKLKTQEVSNYKAHKTAIIDEDTQIGEGTCIWHFSHISKGAKIGKRCNLGQNVFVAPEVLMGDGVKVQNNVSIYTGTEIEDEVFLGPSCVLTNISNPRSQINRQNLYEKTILRRGATVGANATIVCGVEIGRYAFIAAGAVVTSDVPDYALMLGVPARQKGYMSRHGVPLTQPGKDGIMICPESAFRYKEESPGVLKCLDLDEEEMLPPDMTRGKTYYADLKR